MFNGNLRRASAVPGEMWGPVISRARCAQASPPWLLLAASVIILTSCKEVPGPRYVRSGADAERGLALIEEVACGACHEIPGVSWPKGRIGPSLVGFDDIGLIAGALPNTPENLARFVRNAPEIKPGSTMPPMPVTQEEARDIAAYLYGLNDGGEDR